MSRKAFKLVRGTIPPEKPSLKEQNLKKIMFYFGDVHSNYMIASTKNKVYKSRIADTIDTCSQFDYIGLRNKGRHTTGGTEKISVDQLKVPMPNTITPDVKHVFSMYVSKDHRMIGIFRENVFVVLFVDYNLELYRH